MKHKYNPLMPRCKRVGKWRGKSLGNFTDEWVWCDDHKPKEAIPADRDTLEADDVD
jgi:hypothetical protein